MFAVFEPAYRRSWYSFDKTGQGVGPVDRDFVSIGRDKGECRRKENVHEELFLCFADGIRGQTGEGATILFVSDEDLKDFRLIVLDAKSNPCCR